MTLSPTLPPRLSLEEKLARRAEEIVSSRPQLPRRAPEDALVGCIQKLLIDAYNWDVRIEETELVVMDMIAMHFKSLTVLGAFQIEDRLGYMRWCVKVKTSDGRILDLTQES